MRQPKSELSERQADILHKLALGKTRAQAAQEIGISLHTLDTHLARAYRFLGAINMVDAIRRSQTSQVSQAMATSSPQVVQTRLEDGALQVVIYFGSLPK
jgi:DNA-binding CsgD family transcriptional regulator